MSIKQAFRNNLATGLLVAGAVGIDAGGIILCTEGKTLEDAPVAKTIMMTSTAIGMLGFGLLAKQTVFPKKNESPAL